MSILSLPEEQKVRLDVFEGPLDLLLYLIKKNEIDIHNIPVATVADQYMEYLDLMRMLDLNIAGEFLVMAATLMLIKSRMLLPPEQRPEEPEEEGEDPRWELVRQLIEYRKFKDAALFLQAREVRQLNVFHLGAPAELVEPEPGLSLDEVGLFDLLSAFHAVLKRLPADSLSELFAASYSVADKMEDILRRLTAGGRLPFLEVFRHIESRQEIVCTFLALLELMRLKQARAMQEHAFGEIFIVGVDAPIPEPVEADADVNGEQRTAGA